MRRRELLRRAATAASLLAGVPWVTDGGSEGEGGETGDDGENTGDPKPIRVEKVVESAWPPAFRREITIAEGEVRRHLTLWKSESEEEVECTDAVDVPDEEWESFRRTVVDADRDSWQETYECPDACPTDVPWTDLAVSVGDQSTTVRIAPVADLSDDLAAVLKGVGEFQGRLPDHDCLASGDAPGNETGGD